MILSPRFPMSCTPLTAIKGWAETMQEPGIDPDTCSRGMGHHHPRKRTAVRHCRGAAGVFQHAERPHDAGNE